MFQENTIQEGIAAMATYTELYNLSVNSDLRNRIQAGCSVVADEIRNEASGSFNLANRLLWAKQTWVNPIGIAQPMLNALLGQSGTIQLTNAQILAVSDTAIRDAIRLTVNVFADGQIF